LQKDKKDLTMYLNAPGRFDALREAWQALKEITKHQKPHELIWYGVAAILVGHPDVKRSDLVKIQLKDLHFWAQSKAPVANYRQEDRAVPDFVEGTEEEKKEWLDALGEEGGEEEMEEEGG